MFTVCNTGSMDSIIGPRYIVIVIVVADPTIWQPLCGHSLVLGMNMLHVIWIWLSLVGGLVASKTREWKTRIRVLAAVQRHRAVSLRQHGFLVIHTGWCTTMTRHILGTSIHSFVFVWCWCCCNHLSDGMLPHARPWNGSSLTETAWSRSSNRERRDMARLSCNILE